MSNFIVKIDLGMVEAIGPVTKDELKLLRKNIGFEYPREGPCGGGCDCVTCLIHTRLNEVTVLENVPNYLECNSSSIRAYIWKLEDEYISSENDDSDDSED